MDIQSFDVLTRRSQIFARIKLGRTFGEYLTDGSRHSQTAIRINIDLADSRLSRLAQLVFGYTDGIFQRAAVFVDNGHFFLRNR